MCDIVKFIVNGITCMEPVLLLYFHFILKGGARGVPGDILDGRINKVR